VPAENRSLNGSSSLSYAQAAQIKGEENVKLEKRVAELEQIDIERERRITLLEVKRYRVTVEFEIGDPANTGIVKIEPVIPEIKTLPLKKTRNRKMDF
jgi:hypothetical protein